MGLRGLRGFSASEDLKLVGRGRFVRLTEVAHEVMHRVFACLLAGFGMLILGFLFMKEKPVRSELGLHVPSGLGKPLRVDANRNRSLHSFAGGPIYRIYVLVLASYLTLSEPPRA